LRKRRRKNLKISVSEGFGFCSGVSRAIKMALSAAARSPSGVYSLGPLIHNPQVVEKLREVGVAPLSRLGRGKGVIVVRSHGASPAVLERARKKGYEIVDATCPFVQVAQRNARNLHDLGYRVLIVGEKQHPEVKGLKSQIQNKAIVVENAGQVKHLKFGSKVGIIAQTTMSVDTFAEVVGEVIKRAREVLVFNTICSETARRQATARALAGQVDVLLVVGGRNSANTSRLRSLCSSICPRTYHVETADEIDPEWFDRDSRVGVVAGASTPRWLVENIVERLKSF
jgi:(E)-4-hydroxy-3-methyl-but-2-enyl pyrophosphate reductase